MRQREGAALGGATQQSSDSERSITVEHMLCSVGASALTPKSYELAAVTETFTCQ